MTDEVILVMLKTLIPLVIVLIWIGVMFEKLSKDPFLSIVMVSVVLIVLYGGMFSIGKIVEIRKEASHRILGVQKVDEKIDK